MGTRNLTCVVFDAEFMIAQYGQWDGYPSGQGRTILEFLRDPSNRNALERGLEYVRFLDFEGADKALVESYDKNISGESDERTPQQKAWFERFMTRDLGGEILMSVASISPETMEEQFGFKDKIPLKNSYDFAADSLFCEWAYVVDMDNGVLEVFRGFNRVRNLEPSDRFFPLQRQDGRPEDGYFPIIKLAQFDLLQLPSFEEFEAEIEAKEKQRFPVE